MTGLHTDKEILAMREKQREYMAHHGGKEHIGYRQAQKEEKARQSLDDFELIFFSCLALVLLLGL